MVFATMGVTMGGYRILHDPQRLGVNDHHNQMKQ